MERPKDPEDLGASLLTTVGLDLMCRVKHVEVEGLRIAYERAGEGPSLVLLQAASMDWVWV
jgi:hypothetical protein